MALSSRLPALRYSPFFKPIRNAYLSVARRPYWRSLRQRQEYYKPFIKSGYTVFDIGANEGEIVEASIALGAGRIIAVEPVPECVSQLRMIHGPVTVIDGAAGDTDSTAKMSVSTNANHLSTLNTEWLDIAKKINRFHDAIDAVWDREIEVKVYTLDTLIRTYGLPNFIKIDVEGYESKVLDGLSYLPCPINFEFNSEYPANTESCLGKPIFKNAEFTFGFDNQMRLDKWVSADELLKAISTAAAGEIFVRPKPNDLS